MIILNSCVHLDKCLCVYSLSLVVIWVKLRKLWQKVLYKCQISYHERSWEKKYMFTTFKIVQSVFFFFSHWRCNILTMIGTKQSGVCALRLMHSNMHLQENLVPWICLGEKGYLWGEHCSEGSFLQPEAIHRGRRWKLGNVTKAPSIQVHITNASFLPTTCILAPCL